MGELDWQEVTRKKRGSVFQRLQFPRSDPSFADDLSRISLSVYVSNFSSHLTVRELWNIYGKVGTLVDVYIANHKNKLGQMFSFCRFIKVQNSETLIRSLSNVWIGKLRLHANVARFDRKNETVKSPHFSVKVTLNKVSYAIRVRELCSWSPNLLGNDFDNEEEESLGVQDQEDLDVEDDAQSVAENFDDIGIVQTNEDVDLAQGVNTQVIDHVERSPIKLVGLNEDHTVNAPQDTQAQEQDDSDPFKLDHLINQKRYSFTNLLNGESIKQPGFPMIDRLEETIIIGFGDLNKRRWVRDLCNLYKVNFLAIQETKMLHVDLWLLRQAWGNSNFDFASFSARGFSGGNLHVRWIVVYAPQSLPSKIDLWFSLSNLTANWDGIVMVMGDFNEVHVVGERFGFVFNDRQAKIFNEFILNASLIDISLGVVFEKGVLDNKSILLKESEVDYGPTPFCFFHSWLEMDGF
nr:RNA-directed DNA polymerase, eukaryota, reverse transcriptase zinc-binding domain protein [Tanacetum cinerariifolium]